MASVTRKSQANRARRREQIEGRLRAAAEALLARGESYAEISVGRLVSEADISRSTFYVYFEDKGDLLRAWFRRVSTQIKDSASPWWEIGADHTREDLHETLAAILTSYRPYATLMAAVFDAASYDALVREQVDRMMAANLRALRTHIEEGQAEGFIAPSLHAAETAGWLMWMAERGQHQLISTATDGELETLVDSFTDIVWFSLYAFAPSRARETA